MSKHIMSDCQRREQERNFEMARRLRIAEEEVKKIEKAWEGRKKIMKKVTSSMSSHLYEYHKGVRDTLLALGVDGSKEYGILLEVYEQELRMKAHIKALDTFMEFAESLGLRRVLIVYGDDATMNEVAKALDGIGERRGL